MKKMKLPVFIILYLLFFTFILFLGYNKKFIKEFRDLYNILLFFLPVFVLIFKEENLIKQKMINVGIFISIILLYYPFKKINFETLIILLSLYLLFSFYKYIFELYIKKIKIWEYELAKEEEAFNIIEKEKIALFKKENENRDIEIREITSLYNAVKDLNNTIKIDDTMEVISEILKKIFKQNFKLSPEDIFYILVIKREFDFIVAKIKGFDESIIKENERVVTQSILKNISPGKDIIYKFFSNDEENQILNFIKSALYIPLYAEKKLFGVLFIAAKKENIFNEKQIEYFKILSNQFAISLEKAYLYEEVEQMSITDSLTGLYVHRYFQDKLENELKRAVRYSKDLSLVIADIDFFKKVNDTYGHLVGDYILKTIALIIKNNITPVDTVARYGGEEFVIILPDTTKDNAHLLAVKIRKEIENYKFKFQNLEIKVTISMGVASYPSDALTRRTLIEKADKALYRAKQEGRNRVVKC